MSGVMRAHRMLTRMSKQEELAARSKRILADDSADDFSYTIKDATHREIASFAFNVTEFTDEDAAPRQGLAVSFVEVLTPSRGLGTKIYEFAAEIACELDIPLVSDDLRSRFSEAFWQKQVKKGRAYGVTLEGDAGMLFEAPYQRAWNTLYSAAYDERRAAGDSHDAADLHAQGIVAAWSARLPVPVGYTPRPDYSGTNPPGWAVKRYVLYGPCRDWRDLSGTRGETW